MAEFCKQCSIELWGEDTKDLAGLSKEPLEEGYGIPVICEGCGFILVDNDGNCIECELKKNKPGHGK